MSNVGCLGPTGYCQLTSPCALACALRVQYLPPAEQPPRSLTEADVRRIVREELARAAKETPQ